MARAPFQVLVYPYRKCHDDKYEYALLKRSDAGYWQAIAGGGEDNETPLEAAKREAYEEAGIATNSDFLQLDTVEPIPVTEFRDSYLSYELSLVALDIARELLKSGGNFVTKIFPGDEFAQFKKKLSGDFKRVAQYRPQATRKSSTEIYLIGIGFKK